jgi:phospho-2-dehydro-3-deoxyheptonate aldolase
VSLTGCTVNELIWDVDPDMNGSFAINRGLKIARRLLLDITEMGLPAAGEFLGVCYELRGMYSAD